VGQVSDQQIGAFHSGKSIGFHSSGNDRNFCFSPKTEQMMQTISFVALIEFRAKPSIVERQDYANEKCVSVSAKYNGRDGR
jgi:hypothetical protein